MEIQLDALVMLVWVQVILSCKYITKFQIMFKIGADGTEMDIQVTKDGVLVIYHNNNLSSATQCGGYKRFELKEINSCRFSKSLLNNFDVISFDEFFWHN